MGNWEDAASFPQPCPKMTAPASLATPPWTSGAATDPRGLLTVEVLEASGDARSAERFRRRLQRLSG